MEEGSLIGKKDQIAKLTREVEALKGTLHENQAVLEDRNLDFYEPELQRIDCSMGSDGNHS